MANALQPRSVIAGEPSRLEIGVAEAGFVDAICDVHGASAHGSFPERGDNAIEKAARLLLAVHDEPFTRAEHPLLGRNVPGALWIEGGGELHVVPDRARVRIEIRVVPGGPSAAEIEARLPRARGRARRRRRARGGERRAVRDRRATVRSVEALVRGRPSVSVGERPAQVGVPAWTDAHNFVDLAGSQAVVWGPGDFGLAHDAERGDRRRRGRVGRARGRGAARRRSRRGSRDRSRSTGSTSSPAVSTTPRASRGTRSTAACTRAARAASSTPSRSRAT